MGKSGFTSARVFVLGAVLLTALALAVPGSAVINGVAVSPAPSWAAYINASGFLPRHQVADCSGALVAPSWVLTAAHCVVPDTSTSTSCSFGSPADPKNVTLDLGRIDGKHKGTLYKVTSILLNQNASVMTPDGCLLKNDVALLHLAKSAPGAPLWLAPSAAAVPTNLNLILYGYGLDVPSDTNSVGVLNRTLVGSWVTDTGCALVAWVAATCVQKQGASDPAGGDSGAPWTIDVDGAPVDALTFTGYDGTANRAYGTGITQPSTFAWLHSTLGIPVASPGTIVRDPVSAHAWLIDSQGYRLSIPDGGTYLCLAGQHHQVIPVAASTLQLMAARTAPATCSTGNSNVLIAGTGDAGDTEPNDNLSQLLTSAGYQVTESANVPADLSGFGQVWWVDTHAPTSAEQDQLTAFAKTGRGLYLTGERPCCEDLNLADTSIVNQLIVSVGGITVGGQTGDVCSCNSSLSVNPGVVGNVSTQPFSITTWQPSYPGGMTNVTANSVFTYWQPGDLSTQQVTGAAWDHSSVVGNGRVVVLMDINWTQASYRAPNWSSVAQNVAFFLSGLSSPPGAVVTAAGAVLASPIALTLAQSASSSGRLR